MAWYFQKCLIFFVLQMFLIFFVRLVYVTQACCCCGIPVVFG